MVKTNISFYKRKKEIITKIWDFCTKEKVHVMGKFLFWTFRRWEIRYSFDSWWKMIFSLACNTYFLNKKSPCFELFGDGKYSLLLIQKNWCKMIFSSAWNTMFFENGKVLVLNFSEIRNTVLFSSKKLMESRYFLDIFELFMIFQDLQNMIFRAMQF